MGAWKFGASGTALIIAAGVSLGTPTIEHNGTVSISKSEPDNMAAPIAVVLEATSFSGDFTTRSVPAGTGWDPEFHDIECYWTVNGQPLSAFNAPTNMPTAWNNPNQMKGKKVCFHFPLGTEGTTYTIDLLAVALDGSATAVASTTVTPVDPDAQYPTTQTVCFSTDGGDTFTGKPTGAQEVTSWSGLATAITNATSRLRILFKRGQDITPTSVLNQNTSGEWLNYVGTWSTGAKPILRGDKDDEIFGWNTTHPNTHVTITNIDFRGGWNAANENGVASRTPFSMVNNDVAMDFLIDNCDFSGFSTVWLGLGGSSSRMVIADCTCTDWLDYGFYQNGGSSDEFWRLGCRAVQNVDAGSGPPTSVGKETIYNQHGPTRDDGSIGESYGAICDLFSRAGWSNLSPDTSEQPCWRANQSQLDGAIMHADRCVMEGGGSIIAISPVNTSTDMSPGNFMVERCLLICSAKTWRSPIWCSSGGLTTRSIYVFMPNCAQYHTSFGIDQLVLMEERTPGGSSINNNLDSRNSFYNVTGYNARNTTNDLGNGWSMFTNSDSYTISADNNNVIHAPNLDTPVTVSNISLATNVDNVTTRYKGVRFKEAPADSTSRTVTNGSSFNISYPGGTDQAYWQALSDDKHMVSSVGNNEVYYAELNELTVTFNASNITIQNDSGETWTGVCHVVLDRASTIGAIPSTYASDGLSVPLPTPTGSPALNGATTGLVSYDSFNSPGTARGSSPDQGAVEA